MTASVFQEIWSSDQTRNVHLIEPGSNSIILIANGSVGPYELLRLKVASIGPESIRGMLSLEWRGVDRNGRPRGCPACGAIHKTIHGICWIDSALTKVGLRSQFERDEIRKRFSDYDSPRSRRI